MVTVIVRIPAAGDKPAFEQRIEVSLPGAPTITRPEMPEIELGKVVKIITYPEGAELEAYDGQEITVTASVMCGLTRSSGEEAVFEADGIEAARTNTSNGFVSFKWKATVEPARAHKLCVSVPKSGNCPNFGSARDCRMIAVSRIRPGIEEQLKKEREEYRKSLQAIEDERRRIRELYQTVPISEAEAAASAAPAPTISITPEITPEITVPPRLGTIVIPSIPKPIKIGFPINIKIDGESKGEPPVSVDVEPGTHIITAELRGFTPISKKVKVESDQTVTITDIIFGG
jgi:hypothetical protein